MDNKPSIFNMDINVTKKDINYNQYRDTFSKIIEKSIRKFEEFYFKELAVEDGFTERISKFGTASLDGIVYECLKELIKNKIYEVDHETFLGLCNAEDTNFSETMKSLENALNGNPNAENSEDKGGIAGVLKNASGFLNNKNSSQTADVSNQKRHQILNNPNTVVILKESLYDDGFVYFKIFIEILQKSGLEIKNVSNEDVKKSKAIFNNLKSNLYEEDSLKKSMWVRILEYYPYDVQYYTLLLNDYPNDKKDTIKLIEWFNMPLQTIVENLLSQKYDLENITELEVAEQVKKNIVDELTTYNLKDSYLIDLSDALIEKIKNEKKTYLGIVYETELQKNQAEALDLKFKDWIANVTPNDLGMTINLYLYILNEESEKVFPFIRQTNALTMQEIIIKDIKENHNHTVGELDYYMDILTNDKNIAIHQEILRVLQKQSKKLNKNLLGIFSNQ
jgi:hypothetical protein